MLVISLHFPITICLLTLIKLDCSISQSDSPNEPFSASTSDKPSSLLDHLKSALKIDKISVHLFNEDDEDDKPRTKNFGGKKSSVKKNQSTSNDFHDTDHQEEYWENQESPEDYEDKIHEESHVIDFKLSDLLKIGGKIPLNPEQEKQLNEIGQFVTNFLEGKSDSKVDLSILRQIRTFLQTKVNRLVSTGCLGDLVYFVDSLLEYHLAQYDVSNVCIKPAKNKHNFLENFTLPGKVDCDCSKRVQNVLDENSWTLDVFDAFGKFPSGVTKGNLWMHGNFEQCMQISVPKSSTKHVWRGRYSRVDFYLYKDKLTSTFVENDRRGMFSGIESGLNVIQLPSSLPECNVLFQVKLGVCFPTTCTKSDLETIIEYVINIPQKLSGKRVVCAADVLYHDEPSLFDDPIAAIVISVIIVLVALMFFGTCYDFQVMGNNLDQPLHYQKIDKPASKTNQDIATLEYSSDQHPTFVKILLAFSVRRNGKKIFDRSSNSTKDHVKCLHGIRALSILWVLWGHSYSAGILFIDNAFDVLNLTKHVLNQLILNATLSVDAFFLMSGTLLAFLWMKEMKRTNGERLYNLKTWILFYMHRYIRLTPVYAFVLAAQIFLVRYMTDGPMWNPMGLEPKNCRTGWWTNLLYINNLLGLDRLCMVWSWYLANDMQFFFLSPPLLILLWINGVMGIAIIILLLVCTSLIRGFIVLSNDAFPPVNIMFNDLDKLQIVEEYTSRVYISPHCRCGPYLVGLVLGYVLFRYRKSIKLSKISNAIAWLAATTTGLVILFGLYEFCKNGRMPDSTRFLYGAFGRVLWSVFLAWIVLAGSTGHGGFVNKFLSSKHWKPLSRLVYCAYLIHPTVMLVFYGSVMTPIHFDGHYQVLILYCGHVFLTFFLAFWLSCAVELPTLNLEHLIFRSNPRKKSSLQHQDGRLSEAQASPPLVHHHHHHHHPTRTATTQKLLSNPNGETSDNNLDVVNGGGSSSRNDKTTVIVDSTAGVQ